ncbi:hypothetical protein KAFR_0H02500 [Kazachstania africana CBS 2517]|uniref:Uncharacterized protein n=1 Tax=Kazachstania africana (strain ATCC 22294 / BCRC 22015 / CBS 2517 / CECT 1963 / NBRC 1671 / NRRL Y-8276) TaxID=1071382 RepID=H2AZA3_KAZAF|nr:hypothetical protein KAFR_0H02500 [Kazachstania africana CBS 2517]CCF59659.1 hypothetical protein KAFR_0H02500 [Kazachstania africana CBS 2517]
MKIVKEDAGVNAEWLWQNDDNERSVDAFDRPEKTYLIFGIFVLDRLSNDVGSKLSDLSLKLEQLLKPWNASFPWTEYNGVSQRLMRLDDGMQYIFGHVCVEDNVQDEEILIVNLLHKLSKDCGPEVFIRVCDTDGDFLLIECNEALPEEYQYPVANNRLWLHEGRFKMIPTYFYAGRGLTYEEALEFLSKAYYKCIEINSLSEKVTSSMLTNFPNNIFSNLGVLRLEIEDVRSFELLKRNPKIVSPLLKQLMSEDSIEISFEKIGNELHNLDVMVPQSHANILVLYLENHNFKKDSSVMPVYAGRIISRLLNECISRDFISVDQDAKDDGQKVCTDIFEAYPLQTVDLLRSIPMEKDVDPNEELIEKLGKFFSSAQDSSIIRDEFKEQGGESDRDSDADNSDSAEKEFFKENNVDISEDDFFEFFLKEALKMKDSDIDLMRSSRPKKDVPIREPSQVTKENGVSEEVHEIPRVSRENDSLSELFESFNMDGDSGNLFHTMLRELSKEK